MELNIRDWMIVIGVLLFLAVVLDGYRRAQRERKKRVKMTRKAERSRYAPDEPESYPSELPNGGNKRLAAEALAKAEAEAAQQNLREEDALDPLFSNPFETLRHTQEDTQLSAEQESFSALADDDAQDITDAEPLGEPEEILVMHVLATDSDGFQGEDLLNILLGCDCRFGDMNIFHRYEEANGKGRVQFSIVNVVEPGIFKLDSIQEFATPGISLFMCLPGPKEPMEAFNSMVETAQCIVRNLNGTLKDEYRSAMTEQTLEHGRQRIRDYLQRKLRDHV